MKTTRLQISTFLLIITFLLLLTACSTEEIPPTPVPDVETPTPQPTVTEQSPPATSTDSPPAAPTSSPFPLPTPLPPREVGSPLMSDDFTSAAAWNTIETAGSSVNVNENRITIDIKEPHSYIFSLRNSPTLENFCAEIDVHPILCEGEDAYGIVFRSNGSSSYRYALSCDGKVRLDLRKIFESPQDIEKAHSSVDALSGYPGDVRLGLCAAGAEMSFYLNGNHQFTIVDDQLSEAGSIGVFAETAQENTHMAVDFSRLLLFNVTNR